MITLNNTTVNTTTVVAVNEGTARGIVAGLAILAKRSLVRNTVAASNTVCKVVVATPSTVGNAVDTVKAVGSLYATVSNAACHNAKHGTLNKAQGYIDLDALTLS